MLRAADIPLLGSKLESSFYALAGGRLHDIRSGVTGVIESRRLDADQVIYVNFYANSLGPRAFVEEFNGGRSIEVVITDPVGIPAPVPSMAILVKYLLLTGIVVMLVGLAFRRTRALAVIGLLLVGVFALRMGWIRADNLRFLLATSVFGITMALGILVSGIRDASSLRVGYPLDNNQSKDGELAP